MISIRLAKFPVTGMLLLTSSALKLWTLARKPFGPTANPQGLVEVEQLLSTPQTLAVVGYELIFSYLDIVLGKRRLAGIGGSILLIGGITWFSSIIVKGNRAQCQCFGAFGAHEIRKWSVARNGLLLSITLNQVLGRDRTARLVYRSVTTKSRLFLLYTAVLQLLVIFYLLILLSSKRRAQEVAKRLVQVGEVVPEFEVLQYDGSPVNLVRLNARRDTAPFLLMIGTKGCGGCEELWRRIETDVTSAMIDPPSWAFVWSRDAQLPLSESMIERVRLGGQGESPQFEYFDDSRACIASLGVSALPVAVILDVDGRVVESPSIGKLATLACWKRWVSRDHKN